LEITCKLLRLNVWRVINDYNDVFSQTPSRVRILPTYCAKSEYHSNKSLPLTANNKPPRLYRLCFVVDPTDNNWLEAGISGPGQIPRDQFYTAG
jgi:hypothetical protein